MARLRDAVDRGDEALPALALSGQHLPSGGGEPVVAPAALALLLHPSAGDPAAALQAIEQRIEGSDLEDEVAVGSLLDHLAQLVAVARASLEQSEDDQLGAALLELAVEDAIGDGLHSHILL
jgi:hypothetical protein